MTRRLTAELERRTGYAGWSVIGAVSGLVLLGLAMIGLHWDVAWHVDLGRDKQVFTLPHVLILAALVGLMAVSLVTIAVATATQADVRLRFRRWRVPSSALLLLLFRAGGFVAFFLDELWHRAYGVDVTLLSPPHLGLLASGSLSAIALWLMLLEGRTEAGPTALGRALHVVTLASVLIALSTYQLEFDYGVPLFSLVLLPVLLVAASGLALIPARLAIGPGGAIAVAVTFLALRGPVTLLMGALGHTMPHLALYLPAALAVELVAWRAGTDRPVRFAVTCAGLIASLGLAGEWAWQVTVGHHHIAAGSWPLAATLVIAASLGGTLLGTALAGRDLPPVATVLAGLLLVVAVGMPTQRRVGSVDAVVSLDRLRGDALVTVELRPPTAARGADLFMVWAVQGDGRVRGSLREVEPGVYRSNRRVPVGGEWKTVVVLYRGTEVMAVPIALPADREIGASQVPAVSIREVAFGSVDATLLREAHDGPRWTAVLVYAGLAAVMAVWLGFLARAVASLRRDRTRWLSGRVDRSCAPAGGRRTESGLRRRRRRF
ncbi:MAG: hypothetical protein KY412_02165 [Actinobacteria bacterium]|nr:hypothetical protein [Actinomycetota bacterium]